jgi:hypothetical protein
VHLTNQELKEVLSTQPLQILALPVGLVSTSTNIMNAQHDNLSLLYNP